MNNLYFFKNCHLSKIVILFLLFNGVSVSAQQVYNEHLSTSAEGNSNYNQRLDYKDYTKVLDKNGTQVYLKNLTTIQNPHQAERITANVTLTINFVFDDSQFFVPTVLIYDEAGYLHITTYQEFTNPLVVSVPSGTYDILTEYQPIASGKTHIVLQEQQTIQGNTNISSNISVASNYFSTTAYNENGNILEPVVAGGYILFQRLFYFNPINSVIFGDYYSTFDPFGGQDPDWNFYINNVSDRYSFIQTLKGQNFDLGSYFSKFQTITGIQGAVSIANDPGNWSYHTEQFQPTIVANDPIHPANFTASTYNGFLIGGWATSSGGTIDPGDEPFRGFLNNPMDGDPADFWVVPAIIDRFVPFSPTTGGISYFTKGSPVFSDGNEGLFYGSGDVSVNYHSDPNYAIRPFLGDDYYQIENNDIKLLPLHPKFIFDNRTTPTTVLANNVPITVTGFRGNKFKTSMRGRYGETRESDYLATQIVVKQDATVVFSGYYEDFENFDLPSGKIEIILSTANTLVEGLQGTNTTTISLIGNGNDAPPTLQHLQIRDSDDQVTSILDSNEGAVLRLAAGDFKYMAASGGHGYYAYEAGNNVTVSYSVHNQNNWVELPLTEYPEYFQMPAFGDYYEASLSEIRNANTNIWYDLKTICTDANGNSQEQVLSPAFKINNPLGIQENASTKISIYPNPFSNRLNVELPEDISRSYTFRITDLMGRVVCSKIQSGSLYNWNTSFLDAGVYILSIENNGKTINRKIIKL